MNLSLPIPHTGISSKKFFLLFYTCKSLFIASLSLAYIQQIISSLFNTALSTISYTKSDGARHNHGYKEMLSHTHIHPRYRK